MGKKLDKLVKIIKARRSKSKLFDTEYHLGVVSMADEIIKEINNLKKNKYEDKNN